ncbi:MAG: hypothetical protein A3G58_00705 [Candidatus Colwellbacteria bacterium RIFCSPLOWO2_12_FULL_46_17]|uniref:NodB homology domain-containing protein n=1 Tax=Candidatus Colwellbacteria bacterium RIFCSPLOWO2_12_FULL_46_17 TaxID=1797695 RepID=A0A1G1ZDN7_9BACT|nr:MAG: hypothetical protein A3G58_00705 [Candidatus Colwellbacteria bacterium RIFCSPLOWO2_12_FULL_46_17]
MKYRHTAYRRKIWGVLVVSVVVFAFCVRPSDAGESGHPAPDAIGFTFDDGPHPRWTPVVLDVLDAYGVKATFFVVGWRVDKYPEIAREIVERGHSIQIHGYSHNPFTEMSDARIEASILNAQAAIYRATGVLATCVRPPYGARSARVERVINEAGFAMVMWSFNSLDVNLQSSSGILRQTVRATPGRNILAHDTWGSIWQTALPKVLEEFQSRGYGFDTVCENYGPFLSTPKTHGPGISIT